jgi:hypothetical protein
MGVTLNGQTLLHRFVGSRAKGEDPALVWFVDVTLEGQGIPSEPGSLRQWLLERERLISDRLRRLAEQFRAGTDFPPPPFRYTFSDNGLEVTVVYSAMRRIDCVQMAKVFEDLAKSWGRYLKQLEIWSEPASSCLDATSHT